jgi:hypothetical protein
MTLTRKAFLSSAAAALAIPRIVEGAEPPPAPPAPTAVHPPVMKASEWDQKKLLEVLKVKKEHKVMYQSHEAKMSVPGLASLYLHVQGGLNAAEFSMGWGKGGLATLAVMQGPSSMMCLNDAMWAKYKIGELAKVVDAAGKPEVANLTYKGQTGMSFDGEPGAGGNVFQDWSAEACMKRGATFAICQVALALNAGRAAMLAGVKAPDVFAEWKQNVLPGFMIVPSAIATMVLAQEHGWKQVPLL